MNRGFTLIEILVCISIIALLASILLPVVSNSKKNAHRATCQSNLRSVGQTVHMYVDDHDGEWPSYQVWTSWNSLDGTVPPSARPASSPRLAGCPLADVPADKIFEMKVRGYIIGYAYNMNINSWNDVSEVRDGKFFYESFPATDKDFLYPTTTVTFFDAEINSPVALGSDPHAPTTPYPYDAERGWERHNGGANYLFADNHVQWLRAEQVLSHRPKINDGTKPSFALQTRVD